MMDPPTQPSGSRCISSPSRPPVGNHMSWQTTYQSACHHPPRLGSSDFPWGQFILGTTYADCSPVGNHMSWQTTCQSACHHPPRLGSSGLPWGQFVLGTTYADCSPVTFAPHAHVRESSGTYPASSRRRESPSRSSFSIPTT
jgi:hypothetical protein